jgi:predicted GIY-YIG superfamily endonuclease
LLKVSDRAEKRGEMVSSLSRDQMPAWFYILRLQSGSLYVGSTRDLDQRCKDHFSGKACRTTVVDPPTKLVHSERFYTYTEAHRREAQVKRWSRAKKEALVSGDLTTLQKLAKSK